MYVSGVDKKSTFMHKCTVVIIDYHIVILHVLIRELLWRSYRGLEVAQLNKLLRGNMGQCDTFQSVAVWKMI